MRTSMTVSESDDFRSQIDQLAQVARKELLEKQELAREKPPAKRISRILWIGGILVVTQAAILGIQMAYQQRLVPEVTSHRPHPLLFANDCKGVTYRTFRAALAYRRDNGSWPATLQELVDRKYIVEPPVDPRTGAPLYYARKGEGFKLDCSPPAAEVKR
ncbi:MAG: hypothetical protein ACREQY_11480 [Candidatus Binatia bacterium]